VDRLTLVYTAWSPYVYTLDNPIGIKDPNGLWADPVNKPTYRGWYGTDKYRYWAPSQSHFGNVRNNAVHQGVDLIATVGTKLFAVETGKIVFAKSIEKLGNTIILEFVNDKGEYQYAQYSHLNTIDLKVGDDFTEGQEIGVTGKTGNASDLPVGQEHLHFSISKKPYPTKGLANYENPENYMDIATPQKPETYSDGESYFKSFVKSYFGKSELQKLRERFHLAQQDETIK
jgi:murein DD-endopeptidase MepM/ murein hydrolase activator NlpD